MPVADDSPGRAVRSPPPRLLAPLLAQEVYDGQEDLRPRDRSPPLTAR